MSWWLKYTGGNSGSSGSSSSSSSSSSSDQGDDNKGGGSDASSSGFGNNYTGSQGNPNAAGSSTTGSTVTNNTSVPKQSNPYIVNGVNTMAGTGLMGLGGGTSENRKKESEKNENYVAPAPGGTMTETEQDGTVAVTTFDEQDKGTTTITPPPEDGETNTETETETEEDIFKTLFDDQNDTGLPDDGKKNLTVEEKRALVLKFKAQLGYDQMPQDLRNQADKIIAKINAGEYFGSDFSNMQGYSGTGNDLLAANNKSVSDINQKDALALFKIAIQNQNAGTAREAGFKTTAEALLKSYVETLSPADKAAFAEEAKKIQDAKFADPRKELINMYTQPALLRRLTGLSTLNENQLDYDRLVNEAQRVKGDKQDSNTGQVNTLTSSQMGTDNVEGTTTTAGYGSSIDNPHTTKDFVDADGDGVDDRYQKGPGQPYEGPDLDPNKTDVPVTDTTTAQQANPNSFGSVALQGVYNLIPVKDRFTGKIRYIRQPVSSFGGIYA